MDPMIARRPMIGARVRFRDDHPSYPGASGIVEAVQDPLDPADPPQVLVALDLAVTTAHDLVPGR